MIVSERFTASNRNIDSGSGTGVAEFHSRFSMIGQLTLFDGRLLERSSSPGASIRVVRLRDRGFSPYHSLSHNDVRRWTPYPQYGFDHGEFMLSKMWVGSTSSVRFCYQFKPPTVHLGGEAQLVDLFGFSNTPPQTTA
jgi:hypothetical protein